MEAGDEARRRLEHDLHDGAQLRLMMVIYELLRASAQAQREDDGQQVRALAVAIGRPAPHSQSSARSRTGYSRRSSRRRDWPRRWRR